MAQVLRQRTLVNPAHQPAGAKRPNVHRKRLTDKQIPYFGTDAQKAALRRRRRQKSAAHRTNPRRAHRRRAPAASRPNPSIATFGLAGNPAEKRKKTMAKTQKKHAHRQRPHVSKQRRANPVVHAQRRPYHQHRGGKRQNRRRRNPAFTGRVTGLFAQAAYTIAGAIGTRGLTQLLLKEKNTGVLGYGANALAALLLGYGVKKLAKNQAAATAVMVGGFVGLTLRLIQDFTPLGQFVNLQLAGMDGGLGAILPSSYSDPPLFTGNGAERYIPAALRPAPAPAAASGVKGLGFSSYSASSYR